MPESHREQVKWTPQRLIRWAAGTGPSTAAVVKHILGTRKHPQQGFRTCLGIIRLGERYGQSRLEAACKRAIALGAYAYKNIESILKNGLENKPLPPSTPELPGIEHDNLRGPDYYH